MNNKKTRSTLKLIMQNFEFYHQFIATLSNPTPPPPRDLQLTIYGPLDYSLKTYPFYSE